MVKYIPILLPSNFSSKYLPKRNNTCPIKEKNVHSIFIHNSPKLETTQISTNRCTNFKKTVVYSQTDILLSIKKL